MAPVPPPACEAADSKDRSAADNDTATDPCPESPMPSCQALLPVHRFLVCTEPRTARPSPPASRCCTTDSVHQSCRRAASAPALLQLPAPRTKPVNCSNQQTSPPPQSSRSENAPIHSSATAPLICLKFAEIIHLNHANRRPHPTPSQIGRPQNLRHTSPHRAIPHSSVTQTVPLRSEPLSIRYAFGQRPVLSLIPIHVPLPLRSPRVIAAISVGVVTAVGVASYLMRRRKPTAEDLERERRDLLARSGRITDGTIMDTMVDTMIRDTRNSSADPSEATTPPNGSAPT